MTRQIGDARTDEPHLARTKHLHNVCDMCLTTRRARTLNILCCKFLVSAAFFNLPYRNLDPQNIGETCSRNLRHDKLATRSIYIQRILRAICRPSLMPPLLTRAQHLGPLLAPSFSSFLNLRSFALFQEHLSKFHNSSNG